MKGLLYKDCATLLTSYKRNFLLVLVTYSAIAFMMDMPFMLCALVFGMGVYALSTLSFDEASHWDVYVRTLPISPATVVGAKYILALLLIGGGFALAVALSGAIVLLKGQDGSVFLNYFVGCLSSFALVLVYYAVAFPLSYKVGATKSRSWTLLAFAAVFGGGFTILNTVSNRSGQSPALLTALDTMDSAEAVVFLFWLVLAGVALYVGSWVLSTGVYAHKEF